MHYLDLSIEEIHLAIKEGKVTPKELVEESLRRANALQPSLNAFVTILQDAVKEVENLPENSKENPLYGIPYGVKDNFSTKGVLSTGSSKILNDYIPVYDATAVTKIKEAGAVMIGKTVLDELALGGTGKNGHTGVVHNPWNLDCMSGGSSGGSVAAVAAGIVPFALGSDTGDSVRKPAAYNGVVGFKPTWGRISRFGLFPFATSLDHVAYFTRTVKDSAYLLETLAGKDAKDMTCSTNPVEHYSENLIDDLRGKKIAIVKSINSSLQDHRVIENFDSVLAKLKEAGAEIIEDDIDIRLLKAILPVYMVISCAEATSNDACLDGIKYGPRSESTSFTETLIKTRTEGFSELVKRRFVLGSYFLARENQEKLFIKAQKVRRMIVEETKRILSKADVILFPASGTTAPLIEGSKSEQLSEAYLIGENHLAIGNFTGYPSLTLPSGFVDNMPIGINVTGRAFEEQTVLNISAGIEKVLGYKNQIAKVGGK